MRAQPFSRSRWVTPLVYKCLFAPTPYIIHSGLSSFALLVNYTTLQYNTSCRMLDKVADRLCSNTESLYESHCTKKIRNTVLYPIITQQKICTVDASSCRPLWAEAACIRARDTSVFLPRRVTYNFFMCGRNLRVIPRRAGNLCNFFLREMEHGLLITHIIYWFTSELWRGITGECYRGECYFFRDKQFVYALLAKLASPHNGFGDLAHPPINILYR